MSKKPVADLRSVMPKTAQWVEVQRALYGREWVNGCIRSALDGDPGHFFAIEGGHVLGVPFPPTHPIHEMQQMAVLMGVGFAGFIRKPEEGTHGTN